MKQSKKLAARILCTLISLIMALTMSVNVFATSTEAAKDTEDLRGIGMTMQLTAVYGANRNATFQGTTIASQVCDEVGFLDVTIQIYVPSQGIWGTYSYLGDDIEYDTNHASFSHSRDLSNVVAGFRVAATHYAKNWTLFGGTELLTFDRTSNTI